MTLYYGRHIEFDETQPPILFTVHDIRILEAGHVKIYAGLHLTRRLTDRLYRSKNSG